MPTSLETQIKAGRLSKAMTFHQRVWALTAQIPPGKVTTYAALAAALKTRGYRAVGQALHHNPYAPDVPCHRVVGSDGRLTGFAGGLPKKQRMLADEGVAVAAGRVDLARFGWRFDARQVAGAR
ncbi:MAG: MGMT family protein [Phycisphaeraceae bacterium]